MPELYKGPSYSAEAAPGHFTVHAGYGQPTSGLWVPGKGGKSFGVRGQGNKMIGGDGQEIPLSDQAYSFRWPAQAEDAATCTASYVALIVGLTEANKEASNKLVIEFRDSKWRTDVDFSDVPSPKPSPPVFEREGLASQLSFSILAATAAASLLFA